MLAAFKPTGFVDLSCSLNLSLSLKIFIGIPMRI
jgi:hypothetical protein